MRKTSSISGTLLHLLKLVSEMKVDVDAKSVLVQTGDRSRGSHSVKLMQAERQWQLRSLCMSRFIKASSPQRLYSCHRSIICVLFRALCQAEQRPTSLLITRDQHLVKLSREKDRSQ